MSNPLAPYIGLVGAWLNGLLEISFSHSDVAGLK